MRSLESPASSLFIHKESMGLSAHTVGLQEERRREGEKVKLHKIVTVHCSFMYVYLRASLTVFQGAYFQVQMLKIVTLCCNVMHVCLEVNSTAFSGACPK